MEDKLAEEHVHDLLHRQCKSYRIPVDHRLPTRRDHGYDYRLKPDEKITVSKIWTLWEPGGELEWVEFLDVDSTRYVEEKPSRWPNNATLVSRE